MFFDCYKLTEIGLATALYTAWLEKRSKTGGAWVRGIGALVRFELMEHYDKMKKGQIAALTKYKAVAAVAALVPPGMISEEDGKEIRRMLEEARGTALAEMRNQEGDMATLFKKTAISIQKDLNQFTTAQKV